MRYGTAGRVWPRNWVGMDRVDNEMACTILGLSLDGLMRNEDE